MVQLASLDMGELGNVARRISRSILEQVAPEEEADQAELYPVIDADFMGDGFPVELDAEAWFNRGYKLRKNGDFVGALSCFDEALKLQPDYSTAWNGRGVALSDLGKLEEALASYDKAIELQPDYSTAWMNRGNALSDLGKLEEADASYDKAIELQPDNYEAWFYRHMT